jgi:hypothetical protein
VEGRVSHVKTISKRFEIIGNLLVFKRSRKTLVFGGINFKKICCSVFRSASLNCYHHALQIMCPSKCSSDSTLFHNYLKQYERTLFVDCATASQFDLAILSNFHYLIGLSFFYKNQQAFDIVKPLPQLRVIQIIFPPINFNDHTPPFWCGCNCLCNVFNILIKYPMLTSLSLHNLRCKISSLRILLKSLEMTIVNLCICCFDHHRHTMIYGINAELIRWGCFTNLKSLRWEIYTPRSVYTITGSELLANFPNLRHLRITWELLSNMELTLLFNVPFEYQFVLEIPVFERDACIDLMEKVRYLGDGQNCCQYYVTTLKVMPGFSDEFPYSVVISNRLLQQSERYKVCNMWDWRS